MPYLLAFEIAVYFAFSLCLSHAFRKAHGSVHVLLASWFGGVLTDFAFSVLPNGDNFWHAQASLMLTSRVPLYVPCLYSLMLYIPYELMRKAQLPLAARAGLGGIFAALLLNPYDNLSSVFLFTTWHDSDPAISARLAGNPAGNLLFCLGFGSSFHVLLAAPSRAAAALAACTSGAGAVLFCAAVQLASGNASGAPRNAEVALGAAALLVICCCGLRGTALGRTTRRPAWRLGLAHGIFHGVLFSLAVFGNPQRQMSTGLHQPLGPCDEVEEIPLSGLRRGRFLCRKNFTESFTFECAQSHAPSPHWYTVCGVPNKDYHAHVVSTAISFFLVLVLQEILTIVKCNEKTFAENVGRKHQ